MLFFSLILISKIITVHLLVTNVVKIIIYSLTLETNRDEIRFFLYFKWKWTKLKKKKDVNEHLKFHSNLNF